MFSNPSIAEEKSILEDRSKDSNLPFAEYITRTRALIEARRMDLDRIAGAPIHSIVDANSPFELYPDSPIFSGNRIKYGALLIHGLFDCPFSLRDIGNRLQKNGVLCRSILLPGHGTIPSDLLTVSYQDWIQALHYGVASLGNEVEKLFLVGYSTGAALSIYQALQDEKIAGLVLISPAIGIKPLLDMAVNCYSLKKWLPNGNKQWICIEKEIDYAKYLSIPFNPVKQLTTLTQTLKNRALHHTVRCPVFMLLSQEDETISSRKAVDFFLALPHPKNQLLLYSAMKQARKDKRILVKNSYYPELQIKHFSHKSLPFAPNNPHYGLAGDYKYASHSVPPSCVYGAYNRLEVDGYAMLCKYKLIKNKRCELTYNPDFDFAADHIIRFVCEGL